MSKKNGTSSAVVSAVVAPVVSDVVVADVVVTPVIEAKKDGRGAKFGVPHITDKVIQMTPEQREAWLTEKCATPEIRKDVSDRLTNILTNGKNTTKGTKAPDYASIFAGRDYDELVAAKIVLETAIEASKEVARMELEKIIAKCESEKIRLQEKFGTAAKV
jgi:hypothetical protein